MLSYLINVYYKVFIPILTTSLKKKNKFKDTNFAFMLVIIIRIVLILKKYWGINCMVIPPLHNKSQIT